MNGPIGSPHRLTDGDVASGIVALAQKLLGDSRLWPSLVSANHLVPPYLTLDPTQVYGPALAQATLNSAIAQGTTALAMPNQSLAIWGQATTAVLSAGGISGGPDAVVEPGQVFATAGSLAILTEAIPILAYDGVTLTLATGTVNAYPAGARIQAFTQYPGQTLQVLMPGDILYLPITQTQGFVLSGGQLTDTYGTDLQAPMAWTGTDAAQVSGLALLAQRLRVRFATPLGSLASDPTYGFPNLLGYPTTSVRWPAAVRQTALAEPGVDECSNIVVALQGNRVTIQMVVTALLSGSVSQTANLSLTVPTAV